MELDGLLSAVVAELSPIIGCQLLAARGVSVTWQWGGELEIAIHLCYFFIYEIRKKKTIRGSILLRARAKKKKGLPFNSIQIFDSGVSKEKKKC